MEKFKKALHSLGFSSVYECNDVDSAYNEFIDLFGLFYNLCFPINKVKNKTIKSHKWITKGIKLCSKRKREMLWQSRRKPNSTNKQAYKTYSNRLKSIIKLTQKSRNSYFINNAQNKVKATWKVINSSKNKYPKEGPSKINCDTKCITNPFEIAELFNNYFTDQVHSESDHNINKKFASIDCYLHSVFLPPTLPHDVNKIIKDLKTTHSLGHDGFSTKVIKHVALEISPVLSFITNMCIKDGIFPEALKISTYSYNFEKYIGGKYLGDVLSATLGGLARDNLFPAAPIPGSLETADLSLFEEENCVGEVTRTIEVLRTKCAHLSISHNDALIAQYAAHIISNRAAQLVSVCISTLLRRMDRPHVVVAVDGSVFKRHPRIRGLMEKYVSLLAPEHSFTFTNAEDGSGKGSALTAAIAARIAKRNAS